MAYIWNIHSGTWYICTIAWLVWGIPMDFLGFENGIPINGVPLDIINVHRIFPYTPPSYFGVRPCMESLKPKIPMKQTKIDDFCWDHQCQTRKRTNVIGPRMSFTYRFSCEQSDNSHQIPGGELISLGGFHLGVVHKSHHFFERKSHKNRLGMIAYHENRDFVGG